MKKRVRSIGVCAVLAAAWLLSPLPQPQLLPESGGQLALSPQRLLSELSGPVSVYADPRPDSAAVDLGEPPVAAPAELLPQAAPIVVPIDRGRDLDAIVSKAKELPHTGFDFFKTTSYAETPRFTAPYAAGSLAPADILDAQNALRMVRFLAGVPYENAAFTPDLNYISQSGAVLMAATGQFDHILTKPADMDEAFYAIARRGGSEANISAGVRNISNAVLGFVSDGGENNLEYAGHRRWVLKPAGQNFGIGYARGPINDIYGGHRNSMHVFDGPGAFVAEADTYVAWPNSGDFPIQYFLESADLSEAPWYPWSVNLGAAYQTPDKNLITLTLTRSRGGVTDKTWVFDGGTPTLCAGEQGDPGYRPDDGSMHLAVDDEGYGMGKAIIFRPGVASLGAIRDGDAFTVDIAGLRGAGGAEARLTYAVRFFDLASEMDRSRVRITARHAGAPVAGASVEIDGQRLVTDAEGRVSLRLGIGRTYPYNVSKEGFTAETGSLTVGAEGADLTVGLYMPVAFEVSDTAHVYDGRPRGVAVAAAPDTAYSVRYTAEDGRQYNGGEQPVDAGRYQVTVEAAAEGYKGRAEAALTIAKAPLDARADDQTILYGDPLPELSVSFTGLANGETFPQAGGTDTAAPVLPVSNAPHGRYAVGSHKISLAVTARNYEVRLHEGTLTVLPRPVSVSGLTVFDRAYAPGDVSALVNYYGCRIEGKFEGDDLSLDTANIRAVFADESPGEGKRATITGLALSGGERENYRLVSDAADALANILGRDWSISARQIADSVAALPGLARDARTLLPFPALPEGFFTFIKSTDRPDVVGLDGSVLPVDADTTVTLVLTVTRANGAGEGPADAADTGPLAVPVLASTRYTVAVAAGQGGSAAGQGPYYKNEAAAVRALPDPNYEFEGWYENGARIEGAGAEYTFAVTGARALEARFRYVAPPSGGNSGPGSGGGGGGGGGGGAGTGSDAAAATPRPSGTPKPTVTPKVSPSPARPPSKSPSPPPSRAPSSVRAAASPTRRPSGDLPVMTDVGADYWAREYIEGLVASGIVNGYPQPDGTFRFEPENEITRAELMKLIAASLDLAPLESYDGSAFADWGAVEDWAKPYAAALAEAGIVKGAAEEGGLFLNAGSNVSREEMIVMCVRALGLTPPEGGRPEAAADGAIDDFEAVQEWARDAVAFALNNGMVNLRGRQAAPAAPARRAEAAQMPYKLLEHLSQ